MYVCMYLDDTELDEFGSEANQFVRIDVRLFRSLVPAEYRIHHTTARERTVTPLNKGHESVIYSK